MKIARATQVELLAAVFLRHPEWAELIYVPDRSDAEAAKRVAAAQRTLEGVLNPPTPVPPVVTDPGV